MVNVGKIERRIGMRPVGKYAADARMKECARFCVKSDRLQRKRPEMGHPSTLLSGVQVGTVRLAPRKTVRIDPTPLVRVLPYKTVAGFT